MSLSILDVTPRKKRNELLKKEQNTSNKTKLKKYGTLESETDSDLEKGTLITKHKEKRPWFKAEKSAKPSKKRDIHSDDSDDDDYDDGDRKIKNRILKLSVYVSSGFAVEIKKYEKRVYICFSKGMENERKKFINIPITEISNVQKALQILEKHITKYSV
ncbi:hypothetical protein JTE90_029634 [Oedothorax gibbosus]|uniref:Uncharacterized protein n=1 Tax=Oedothorax gibbosus TaxID=931172 RepID=A0AAV6VGB7_9ARAC|nr:hypothetical protein JTE90_029634 [Oedothorax gibbosus]